MTATALAFAWSPRLLLAGRTVRLPLRTADPGSVSIDLGGLLEISRRYSARDETLYLYLQAPAASGHHRVVASDSSNQTSTEIEVRQLVRHARTLPVQRGVLATTLAGRPVMVVA